MSEMPLDKRLLRLKEVLQLIGLSRSKFYQLRSAGEFPQAVKLSSDGRAVAYRGADVLRWIESRETLEHK